MKRKQWLLRMGMAFAIAVGASACSGTMDDLQNATGKNSGALGESRNDLEEDFNDRIQR